MLDMTWVRDNIAALEKALRDRGSPIAVEEFRRHDEARRAQRHIDILSTEVLRSALGGFEYLQDFQPGQGDFQTGLAQFEVFVAHGVRGSLRSR